MQLDFFWCFLLQQQIFFLFQLHNIIMEFFSSKQFSSDNYNWSFCQKPNIILYCALNRFPIVFLFFRQIIQSWIYWFLVIVNKCYIDKTVYFDAKCNVWLNTIVFPWFPLISWSWIFDDLCIGNRLMPFFDQKPQQSFFYQVVYSWLWHPTTVGLP